MRKRIVVLLIVLITVSLSAFAGAQAEADKGYDLYIYNSKGENAAQFAEMAKAYEAETGVRVRTFSIGSGQDHMETLRAEMNSRNKPSIFSIQGVKELIEWYQGGFVVDFNSITDASFKALANNISPSLRLTNDGKTSFGVPYNVEGYGYIVDRQMIADLFGGASVDAFIADAKIATYAEWEALVKALDAYIKRNVQATVKLNGKAYVLATAKTGLAKNLNGVFAVMGAEKWTYGDHFINVAVNAVFANPNAAANATDADVEQLRGAFLAYAKALDLKTSYLAGLRGAATRGQDFVSSANFGYDQAVQIFADNKAVFFKQGNWAYGNIAGVNAAQAERLEFLPVKMPFESADIKVAGLTVAKLNSSIPVFVPNYYAINNQVPAAEQKLAMDFLVWLNTSATGKKYIVEEFNFIPYNADPATTTLPNSLGNSILDYIKAGTIIAAPYHGAPATWSGDVVGLRLMERYLTKPNWTAQDYKDIVDYAVQNWQSLN
ncbi:MAG: ABC transporter substrate-binding protein [Sphaerochaeta sp.]|jgi:raffinose/stachyose/melibiose transport system substrate-binding protein|nr:ABC transporter substrate-binding protein [Sphaerochaeta sp.]PKL29608.1 MAG: sugar ABC transporter substrate-binding protein [Spirochaetae bacterium HGW-Spirochaetae-2]